MNEPDDTVAPWPLSAATTRMLLAFPPASVLTGVVDWPSQNELIKLCVKELLLRGTWRMTGTQQRFLRSPRVFVEPYWPPPPLPVPLDQFDAAMRRHGAGGELGPTLRRIATAERMLGPLLISATVAELRRYGLIESRTVPAQGFTYEVMVRSAAGDAWAQSAEAWTAAVWALPNVIDVDEVTAERTVIGAAGLLLLVPTAFGSLARLNRRTRGHGRRRVSVGGSEELVPDDWNACPFDALLCFDAAFSLVLDAATGAIDAATGAVDSAGGAIDTALDSAASAVDSAISSGVDSGGGSFGDSGGGFGDSGGGGGGGDSGGGGGGGDSGGGGS